MKRATRHAGTLRIIGGDWRGRRLAIAERPGLRPTPDRVRETLFNWLAPIVPGARCLDLFAGTGALGLEALSRGAGSCLFVERDRGLAARIEHNLGALGADTGRVTCADGLALLQRAPGERFDLAFLDPPFTDDLLALALARLPAHLNPGARVYLEYPATAAPALPPGWQHLRDKRAGQVGYSLASTPTDSQDKTP